MKYSTMVYLKDTNALGSVYYSRFFDFMGAAREKFLFDIFGGNAIRLKEFFQEYSLSTLKAECDYKRPLHAFDVIDIFIRAQVEGKIIIMTFDVEKNGRVCARGRQHIGITKNGRLVAIPEIIKNVVEI